ncbi:hypothetical protein [Desulfurobacterium sp.]
MLESYKVIFKDGVFIPVEPLNLANGTEGIVVCSASSDKRKEDLPKWWNLVDGEEKWKRALKSFVDKIPAIVLPEEVKLINRDGEKEIIVILNGDETGFLRPLMEQGYKIYSDTGVFLPIQVISRKRLQRWKDYDREIFRLIQDGISLL